MWRIKSVDVKGLLRNFDIHWDLDPYVNILGGSNGSGKSTLLKAIYMQFVPKDRSDNAAVHSEAVFGLIHSELNNGFQMNVEKSISVSEKQSPDDDKKIVSEEEIRLRFTSYVPEELSSAGEKGAIVLYVNSMEANMQTANMFLSKSMMKERPSVCMLDLMIERRLNQRNAIFSDMMSKAIDSADGEETKRIQDLFSRFSKALKVFMPDYSIKNMSNLIFTREGFSEEFIPYFRLSGGEKQLIYLLLTIANTMEQPTIALLDEVDMGMHVDWKRMLIKQMLEVNPNMQIIASTHSPALIDGWRDNVKEIGQLRVNV